MCIDSICWFLGKIKIVIRAEGSDDPDKQGHCSIKVNGVERSLKLRGHNLVVLDDGGNFVTSGTFDTGDTSRDEGSAMARFLDGLPNERIVLIATQDTKGETRWRQRQTCLPNKLGVDILHQHFTSLKFLTLR